MVLAGFLGAAAILSTSTPSLSPVSLSRAVGGQDTLVYTLVRYLGDTLPVITRDAGGCVWTTYSGWYRLFKNRWASSERRRVTCPPGAGLFADTVTDQQGSGTFRRLGDTVVFQQFDTTRHALMEWGRGLVRRDTLYTGDPVEPDEPRIYITR